MSIRLAHGGMAAVVASCDPAAPPSLHKRRSLMHVLEFELDRDHVELNQLLKLTGVCDSGGSGKALVASGAVSVDGITELRKTCKIRAGQIVRLDEVTIRVVDPSR
jgi:ribosome-associated protein